MGLVGACSGRGGVVGLGLNGWGAGLRVGLGFGGAFGLGWLVGGWVVLSGVCLLGSVSQIFNAGSIDKRRDLQRKR